MSESSASRRRFLKVVVVGTAASGFSAGCGAPDPVGPDQIGDVEAGNVQGLAVGTLEVVSSGGRPLPVAIGRDADGVYAMTLTCTHQGCNMGSQGSVSFSRVYCACHGSSFDHNGNVTSGPARSSLAHFQVDVDGTGNLIIRGDQQVSADTRTAVA